MARKYFGVAGNAWVFAGLINILRELPHAYPNRARYEALFTEMADKLLTRQRSDGFWSTSLMSSQESSAAESSSTAFFVLRHRVWCKSWVAETQPFCNGRATRMGRLSRGDRAQWPSWSRATD